MSAGSRRRTDRPDKRLDVEGLIAFIGTDRVCASFSDRGLTALSLRPDICTGADAAMQVIDLRRVAGDPAADPRHRQLVRELIRMVETGRHEMPLDFSARTPFTQRVYAAVLGIEPGSIRTYKDVALMAGSLDAARAVGNALSRNPFSILMPAHRVRPQSGYCICRQRSGSIKERLLAREGHDLRQLQGNKSCSKPDCPYM